MIKGNKFVIYTIICMWLLLLINPAGYMDKVFATTTDVVSEEITEVEGLGNITTDKLNVRSGPGTEYDSLGKVYSTDTVRIIGKMAGWYKIVYDGMEGYVSADYVEIIRLEEILSEDTTEPESTELLEEAEDTNQGKMSSKLMVVLIAIVVVVILLVVTMIGLKKSSDDYNEDDYEEDDYEEDDYEEDDYDAGDYEYDNEEGDYDADNYETDNHVEVRTRYQIDEYDMQDADDYRIQIDPDFFDNIRNK